MIATHALVVDTFREAFSRKIFWGFFGCSSALILFFIFLMKIDLVEGAVAAVSIFGKEARTTELDVLVRQVYGGISSFLITVGMFLAVFASAGLIPTVFEPGRIELLLSKPVSRTHLLMGRYLGTLLVIAFNMFYLVLGVWMIFGVKTGIWGPAFLLSAGIAVFAFAVMLTVVLLVAVWSESAVLSSMVTFALIVASLIVAQHKNLERLLTAQWARDLVDVLYYALPKLFDLERMSRTLVTGGGVESWMPVWSTLLFGITTLSLAIWSFARRNF